MNIYKFTVIFEPEKDQKNVYNASIPALPGCLSFGESLDETRYNIREATELYLEHLLEQGGPIPKNQKVEAPEGITAEEITVGIDFDIKTGFEKIEKMSYA